MTPTSLYIHVPFCSGKCFYCDFFSVPAESRLVEEYLRALKREAQILRHEYFDSQKPTIKTVYIGGGTPTSLTAENLRALGRILDENFHRTDDCEFTSEANPESVTVEKIQTLTAGGVNRISIGAQTFDDDLLTIIGRRHTSRQTLEAVQICQRQNIENMGLDLIFALPGQTITQLHSDLEMAKNLPIKHLSCYELTLEPGTPLYSALPKPVDPAEEDRQVAMFLLIHDFLTAEGFEHYEISNYARLGFQCRHNVRYWKNQDYIGLGPSAAGFLHRRRYKNFSTIETYCRQILERGKLPVESEEILSDLRFAGETAMLNLRTAEGIIKNDFQKQTGIDPSELFKRPIEKFANLELLKVEQERIALTLKGFTLANEVLAEFLQ